MTNPTRRERYLGEVRRARYAEQLRLDAQRVSDYIMQIDCERLNAGRPMLTKAERRGVRAEALRVLALADCGRELVQVRTGAYRATDGTATTR